MAAFRYRAKIDHTEKTIQALFRAEYHVYEQKRMLFRFLLGLAVVFLGVFAPLPNWARAILLLIGAWLIASLDFPSQIRADKALEARGGQLPRMTYEFFDDHLRLSGEGSMDVPYAKLRRLIEDRKHLYLFLSRDSVCMLDPSTLQPNDPDAFRSFLAEKTGLPWRKDRGLLSLDLADLILMFRERKNSG